MYYRLSGFMLNDAIRFLNYCAWMSTQGRDYAMRMSESRIWETTEVTVMCKMDGLYLRILLGDVFDPIHLE